MNILFCSEGFIVDGVASYNLYLSSALSRAGHSVAIVGRWAGRRGFQKRHKEAGVKVIQCLSATVDNAWLVDRALAFRPDVIITDSRRSFPLALRIGERTEARVVTIFHDPPQYDREGERGLESLTQRSDAWVTAEKPIHEELLRVGPGLPVLCIQRPITGVVCPKALPPRDPFRLLCLGRLSRWKSPGLRAIAQRAGELKRAIPSLQIDFVGGGRRRIGFWACAVKANLRARECFVRVAGSRPDPRPWMARATVVCAGATSAIEAILSNRPVLAFSGFWLGLVTPQNLMDGVSTHFGERRGELYVRDDPDVVIRGLVSLYNQWNHENMSGHVDELRRALWPDFDSEAVAEAFRSLFSQLS